MSLPPPSVLPYLPCPVEEETDLKSKDYDAVVVVASDLQDLPEAAKALIPSIKGYVELDKSASDKGAFLIHSKEVPSGRLVYSPVGPVNRDFDDVRRFHDAGKAGVTRAIDAGAKRILMVTTAHQTYPTAPLVTILGGLNALYVSMQAKQSGVKPKATKVGILAPKTGTSAADMIKKACALEAGRTVARDIASADPAYLPPPAAAQYVWGIMEENDDVEIIKDQEYIGKNFPIMAAVNRANNDVPKYESRLIRYTYTGEGPIEQTLMFVGKGVTFDSGGMDLKVGGNMLGMSHDKGGAAGVAGFLKVLSILRPKGLKVHALLPFVRNGVGPDAVTCDEVITARCGKRMRIINTDAEGRMIMVDPLCKLVEMAQNEVNPHLFTVATLTGHAFIAAGPGYALTMDNGPARAKQSSEQLKKAGEAVADPMELSSIRREDYDFHYTNTDDEDLLQSYARPSTQTPRGHQIPAAFLILGSGLDKHGIDSKKPIPYTHLDIAGAEEAEPTNSVAPKSSGSPVLALAARYILPRL